MRGGIPGWIKKLIDRNETVEVPTGDLRFEGMASGLTFRNRNDGDTVGASIEPVPAGSVGFSGLAPGLTIGVTIIPGPTVVCSAAPLTVAPGQNVTLTTTGTKAAAGATLASWSVAWGDGLTSSGIGAPPTGIVHPYSVVGVYSPVLTVIDSNGKSNSATANSVTVALALPAAPSNLAVSQLGDTGASVTWKDNSSNESLFLIERRVAGGTFAQIATVLANVTSYVDSGLSNGVTYEYRVRASNATGTSAYSTSVSVTISSTPASGDSNAYFAALIIRPDYKWAYSLRPQAGHTLKADPYYVNQLASKAGGGFTGSSSGYRGVTYDPASDTDPNKQDAAKLTIQAFGGSNPLTVAMTASDLTVHLTGAPNSAWYHRHIMIGSEILGRVVTYDATAKTVTLEGRGLFGTTPASHAIGDIVTLSGNSLLNDIHIPCSTLDGHNYLFTWDGFWTDSYIRCGLTNHKAYNLESDGIWFEPDASYAGGTHTAAVPGFNRDTMVAGFQVRSYNALGGKVNYADNGTYAKGYAGPGVTDNEPLEPQLATFAILPNRWIRFWVYLEQRANDYDLVSTWVADADSLVHIHDRLPVSLRESVKSLNEFTVEFNTSTDQFTRSTVRDLIAYSKNIVCLQDITLANVIPLLQKPVLRDTL